MNDKITTKAGLAPEFKDDDRWRVSASQIKTADACMRKWGFKYIDKIPDPVGKAAIFGSAVHKQLEGWFEDGEDPDESKREGVVAATGLHLYPKAEDVDHVELSFVFDFEGILYRGFIDLAWKLEKEFPTICDHKTSSDPKKWGLNEVTILEDIQALTYSVFALDFWVAPQVNLQWTYYKTRGKPNPFNVTVTMDREDARTRFNQHVAPLARDIYEALELHKEGVVEDANDLPVSVSACGDFGGCPYADICRRTSSESLDAVFGNKEEKKEKNTMGLREMIQKKKNGKKLPPPRVNAPEAPEDPKVSREISKAVGATTGSIASKKEKARAIANAAAGATSPEEAKEKSNAALEKVEHESLKKNDTGGVKSPSKDEIIAMVAAGTNEFAKTRAQHTEANPFAHGKTLKSMEKEGTITFTVEGTVRRVVLTETGAAQTEAPEEVEEHACEICDTAITAAGVCSSKCLEELNSRTEAVPEKVEDEVTVEIDTPRRGNDLKPVAGVITVNASTRSDVLAQLLVSLPLNDAKKAYAFYCEEFPRG